MPLVGLSARRFWPPLVTISWPQPCPSALAWADSPEHTVSRPPLGSPAALCWPPEESARLSPIGMQTKSTMVMLASDGLVTDASTRARPGFSGKVSGDPIENQIRAPARCGIVIGLAAPPEAVSGIAQFTGTGWLVLDGDGG